MTNVTDFNPIASVPMPRTAGGRFAPGPGAGRPKGVKNKRGREALAAIQSFCPDALEQLHKQVLSGEKWACEFVLCRILPTNSRMIEFEDATTEDAKAAFVAGEISPVELKDIIGALEKAANIEEWEAVKERLERLERLADEK